MDNSIKRTHVAFDTLTYGGVAYAMHYVTDSSYFHTVHISDIVTYFIADGIFYVFRDKIISMFDTEQKQIVSFFAAKYIVVTGGLLIGNLIMGKHNMIGTVINSAVALGAQGLIDYAYQKSGFRLGQILKEKKNDN